MLKRDIFGDAAGFDVIIVLAELVKIVSCRFRIFCIDCPEMLIDDGRHRRDQRHDLRLQRLPRVLVVRDFTVCDRPIHQAIQQIQALRQNLRWLQFCVQIFLADHGQQQIALRNPVHRFRFAVCDARFHEIDNSLIDHVRCLIYRHTNRSL
ncbi:hypothetical protein SDC9_73149 [bioreactor metagenome]|uniref:Uncharacterized protein n=1 Tax=bioreactor metagenome TaxID=1076179 RepID=A0A644YDM9_9ZZZZ